MKIMTCKQLGGACELEFRANTFEEMAELSRKHAMEMHHAQDAVHLQAMDDMRALMKNQQDMEAWYESKQQAFAALPEIEPI